jgi:hypothetical protein
LLYVTIGSSIASLSRSFASADDILEEFLQVSLSQLYFVRGGDILANVFDLLADWVVSITEYL